MPLLWVFEFIIGVHTHTQNDPLPHNTTEGQSGDSERVHQVRCHCSKVSYHSPVPRFPLQCVNVCLSP